ncbi:30S ribosomal protein S18 [Telmatocola sphagniphila]|uniref:Small ribosomal subunit protein bS18 n=1 Tax=Telmatocola sphagniphila TaxID=1123043 RepID=A0A8E6B7C6_9BACT|nr:30S ribosomal protein S18 [Telmatocola sphagniphila]QVL31760.1 30S ribosomal protein S18 [Telmatocola sphagniphila]
MSNIPKPAIPPSREKPSNDSATLYFDYKDVETLCKFITADGKILPRRLTGLSVENQKALVLAVKRARFLALLQKVTK